MIRGDDSIFQLWASPAGEIRALAGWGAHNKLLGFDGVSWTELPAPPFQVGLLRASSARDVWLVGSGVAHYDGASTTLVPEAAGSWSGLWVGGPDHVWVAGGGVLHFDGVAWKNVQTPRRSFQDVWGSGADDVWLLTPDGEVLHGGASVPFELVPADSIDSFGGIVVGARLFGIAPDEVWIAIKVPAGDESAQSLLLHHEAGRFRLVGTVPEEVNAAHGLSGNDVWFAGYLGVWHWNGRALESMNLPGERSWFDVLEVAPGDVWVVGGGAAMHWNGTGWARSSTGTGLNLTRIVATDSHLVVSGAPGILRRARR